MILIQSEIKNLIPQRPPILMLDGVEEYSQGQSILTTKWIGEEAAPFKGHFPGFPLLPGVFLIEAAAQTGAVMMGLDELKWEYGQAVKIEKAPKTVGVLGGSKVRFKKPVFPNTRLYFSGIVEWKRGGTMSLKVKAFDEANNTLMSGSVTLSTVLKSQLQNSPANEKLSAVL